MLFHALFNSASVVRFRARLLAHAHADVIIRSDEIRLDPTRNRAIPDLCVAGLPRGAQPVLGHKIIAWALLRVEQGERSDGEG